MTTSTDTRIMSNAEANLLGTVRGGNIMKMVDDTAGVSANCFAQGPAVTAGADEMVFRGPDRAGATGGMTAAARPRPHDPRVVRLCGRSGWHLRRVVRLCGEGS